MTIYTVALRLEAESPKGVFDRVEALTFEGSNEGVLSVTTSPESIDVPPDIAIPPPTPPSPDQMPKTVVVTVAPPEPPEPEAEE